MNISVLNHEAIMKALVSDLLSSRISNEVQEPKDTQFNCVYINEFISSFYEIKKISESIRDHYCLKTESSSDSVQAQTIESSISGQESMSTRSIDSEIEDCSEDISNISNCLGSTEEVFQIERLESVRDYMLNSINQTTNTISENDFLFYDGLKYLVQVLKDTSVTLLDLTYNNISLEGAEYLESVVRDARLSSINVRIHTTEYDSFDDLVQCEKNTKATTLDLSCNEKIRDNSLDFIVPLLKDTQIATLDLSNNSITCESLKILAQYLLGTKVTSLNLSCNHLGSDVMSCLSLALKSTQITSIDLSYASINCESIEILSSCLVDLKITAINLSGNDLSYDAINWLALALPKTQITSIDLSFTTMNCESLKLFASCLVDTKIASLNLSNNQFGLDGMNHLAMVLKNTEITSVDLSRNYIKFESLNVLLSGLMETKISSLSLSGNNIDCTNYLSEVLKKTHITKIDLSENDINCEGLKALASCLVDTKISSLHLGGNKLGYVGVKYLVTGLRNSNVTTLNLSNNSLGCNSLKNLVLCLQDTKIITLDISGNNICCNSFYLASVLKHTQITHLNLSNSKFCKHDPKNLILGLKKPDILFDLSGKNVCSIVLYYLAFNLNKIQTISLNLSCIMLDYDGLKYFPRGLINSSVVSLDLSGNRINCKDVLYLAQVLKHTRISSLNLSNNEISNIGFKNLIEGLRGSQITLLNLSENSLENESFECLAENLKCTGNIQLELYGINITSRAAYEVFGSVVRSKANSIVRIGFDDYVLPRRVNLFRYPCCYIEIDHLFLKIKLLKNANESLKLLNHAYQKSGITKVIFDDYNYYNWSHLTQIFDNVNIREIEMKTHYLNTNIASIFVNSNISELKVDYKNVIICGKPNMKLISLKFYCMSDFKFTSPKAEEEEEALRIPFSLDFFIPEIDSQKIAHSSCCNKRLSRLNDDSRTMVHLPLHPQNVHYTDLKSFIINNTMYLDLSSINLEDEQCEHLPEVLKNSKVISLNLSNNSICAKGVGLIANALSDTDITYIDLTGNNIGYLGYTYLMNVVNRTSICWLSLAGNRIENILDNAAIELSPHVVTRNDSPMSFQIRYLFKELVSLNTANDKFEFIVPQEHSNPSVNLNHYPFLIKNLLEFPSFKIHIYDMIYMKSKKHDSNVMNKIDNFIENIKNSFYSFFEKQSELEQFFGYESFVDLVRTCEYLELGDVVSRLLLHRGSYYVNDESDILHPFIYLMLHKYGLTLYNKDIESNKKEKIIYFFQNNTEIDGAQEIINLLHHL